MEVLSPVSYLSNMNWRLEESKGSAKWTPAENKMFENALAVFDRDTPDRWHKVAAMVPGKTVGDVIKQYRELEADVSSIEAGLVPIPGYRTSEFTLELVNSGHAYDGFKHSYVFSGKRSSSARTTEQERKKGVPWTEEEHKLFLMGLKKYGKGDWRNISRNFVVTRTPTQVASHAQKYFIRQLSGGKDKRRASIHDITTVNLEEETRTPSPPDKKVSSTSLEQPNPASLTRSNFPWNQIGKRASMNINSTQGNSSMSRPPYAIQPYGFEMQEQNVQGRSDDSFFGAQDMGRQL